MFRSLCNPSVGLVRIFTHNGWWMFSICVVVNMCQGHASQKGLCRRISLGVAESPTRGVWGPGVLGYGCLVGRQTFKPSIYGFQRQNGRYVKLLREVNMLEDHPMFMAIWKIIPQPQAACLLSMGGEPILQVRSHFQAPGPCHKLTLMRNL